MKTIILKRVSTGERGTFGVIMEENEAPFALTIEPPFLDNRRNVSCIPDGEYYCAEYNSQRHGYTYEVTHVVNRSGILFHKGNYGVDDKAVGRQANTKGCILVGEQFEDDCLRASRAGYREFMFRLKGQSAFMLNIINC